MTFSFQESKKRIQISTIFKIISTITLVGTFLMLSYIFYLLFIPVRVLEVKEPMKLIDGKTVYKKADVVEFVFDYCQYKDIPARVDISYVGNTVVQAVGSYRRFDEGCHVQKLRIAVPLSSTPGEYVINMRVSYRPNPLKSMEYNLRTEKFTVEDDISHDLKNASGEATLK